MILARSTYNLNFPRTTEQILEVDLWVKSGLATDALGTPQRRLKRINPSGNTTEINMQIDALCLDYLKPKPVWHSGIDELIWSNTNSVLFTTAAYSFDGDPSQFKIQNQLTTKGWYEYVNGINYNPNKRILVESVWHQVLKGRYLMLPILCQENSEVKVTIDGLENVFSVTLNADVDSRIRYLFFDTTLATEKYITVQYESLSKISPIITIELIDECKFEPKEIIFLNRHGAFQQMFAFKQSTRQIETKDEEFKNAYVGNFNKENHQYQKYNKQGRESVEISTGFLKEEMNGTMEDLMMSEDVYLREGNDFLPINIKTKQLAYQTRKVEKLINYTFEYEMAFDKLLAL
jgi:hypothetical protein